MKEEQIDWESWFNKYQPVMINATHDDGELMEFDNCKDASDWIRENWGHVLEDEIAKHVWTTTSGDGWSYTSTGFHVVDRLHCYVCHVPWTKLYETCMYEEWETTPDNETEGCVWEGDWSGR